MLAIFVFGRQFTLMNVSGGDWFDGWRSMATISWSLRWSVKSWLGSMCLAKYVGVMMIGAEVAMDTFFAFLCLMQMLGCVNFRWPGMLRSLTSP